MAETLTDEDLLMAVRAGRVDSLAELVARWEQPLFRFVYRLLQRREDANDVCQETFLRILHKSDHFREGARFSTWMYQIALNLCRDQARKRKRWSALLVESREGEDEAPVEFVSNRPGPGDEALGREAVLAVRGALAALPPEQREVLVMKEYEGLKFREIAEILGCPESTVKSRMYYALGAMRERLAAQGIR